MSETPRRKSLRRRFGIVCIAAAILMLLAGETMLRSTLAAHPVWLIVYWTGCFVLTALAAFAAIIDAARVRLESREEQRSLLEKTLREVEREKEERRKSKR
jgi:hypothetical protein